MPDSIEGLSQKIVSITLHYITLHYITSTVLPSSFASSSEFSILVAFVDGVTSENVMPVDGSGVARTPQAPRPRGAAGWRGPPGSSRRNHLARGPNKLFAGGPENRRYATGGWWGITGKGTHKKMVLESIPESRKSGNGWKMTWEFIPNILGNRWKWFGLCHYFISLHHIQSSCFISHSPVQLTWLALLSSYFGLFVSKYSIIPLYRSSGDRDKYFDISEFRYNQFRKL